LYYIFPAYVANATPVLGKGGTSIDKGRLWRDGKPIFGPGKSTRGFIVGFLMGTFTGIIQYLVNPSLYDYLMQFVAYPPGVLYFFGITPLLGALMGLGTVTGDLCGAFLKRRIGLVRGAPAPLLDQLDFILGALLFTSFLYPLHPLHIIMLILITPLIHFVANIGGYLLKAKKEPW
jgi:CDP-2,3-bis-(O-geranylgeranyl)-sn-glycerol synthase